MAVADDEANSPEEYCRQIEAYLCRRNDGHLIRIVGPAFEQVYSWATRGVPLRLAFRGIDRYVERYYAKGPRRRPVRIEFCEADVLDVFDEWRRAIGISAPAAPHAEPGEGTTQAAATDGGDAAAAARRQESLPAHLDRLIARLTARRSGTDRSLDPVLEGVVRELDAARGSAKGLRGESRHLFVERLRELDAQLIAAARAVCDSATSTQIAAEADAELRPFRARMPGDAYDQAHRALVDRMVRERFRLPAVTYDA